MKLKEDPTPREASTYLDDHKLLALQSQSCGTRQLPSLRTVSNTPPILLGPRVLLSRSRSTLHFSGSCYDEKREGASHFCVRTTMQGRGNIRNERNKALAMPARTSE